MTQKELKAVYKEELKKAWNNEKMVEFCSKSIAFVIEHDGTLYGIKKPTIETDFCFSHGQNGITTAEEEDRAAEMAEYASKSKEYFINENLKNINRWIERLKKIKDEMGYNWAEGNHPQYMIATGAHYCGQSEDCKLRYYSVVDTFDGRNQGKICNNIELVEKLIEGYEEVKKGFEKRLNTYLKRYGLSKVRSWSYISD